MKNDAKSSEIENMSPTWLKSKGGANQKNREGKIKRRR